MTIEHRYYIDWCTSKWQSSFGVLKYHCAPAVQLGIVAAIHIHNNAQAGRVSADGRPDG